MSWLRNFQGFRISDQSVRFVYSDLGLQFDITVSPDPRSAKPFPAAAVAPPAPEVISTGADGSIVRAVERPPHSTILIDLDTAIQRLALDTPNHPSSLQLTAVYHNLLRQWVEMYRCLRSSPSQDEVISTAARNGHPVPCAVERPPYSPLLFSLIPEAPSTSSDPSTSATSRLRKPREPAPPPPETYHLTSPATRPMKLATRRPKCGISKPSPVPYPASKVWIMEPRCQAV